MKKNPPVAIFSNPGAGASALMGTRVYGLEYQHVQDGKNYRHDFEGSGGDTVEMFALTNGDILLRRRNKQPVWEDF